MRVTSGPENLTTRTLDGDGHLLSHRGKDGDDEVLASLEIGLDLGADITLGDFDIVLGLPVIAHEVKEIVVDVDELVFSTSDIGDFHIVGRGANVFLENPGKC